MSLSTVSNNINLINTMNNNSRAILEPSQSFLSCITLTSQDTQWNNTLVYATYGDPIEILRKYKNEGTLAILNSVDESILTRSNIYLSLNLINFKPNDIIVNFDVSFFLNGYDISESPVLATVITTQNPNNKWDQVLGAMYNNEIIIIPIKRYSAELNDLLRNNVGKFKLVLLVADSDQTFKQIQSMVFGQLPTEPVAPSTAIATITPDEVLNTTTTTTFLYSRTPYQVSPPKTQIVEKILNEYPKKLTVLRQLTKNNNWEQFNQQLTNDLSILFPNDVITLTDIEILRLDSKFITMCQEVVQLYLNFFGLYYDGMNLVIVDKNNLLNYFIPAVKEKVINHILLFLNKMNMVPLHEAIVNFINDQVPFI